MKRRGRAPVNAGRRKDKKKAPEILETSLFGPDHTVVYAEPFPLTTCNVCGGVEDEDLIILCDGPGCTSEIHMYCLTPVITTVPEGDWFCEACDTQGTTVQLRKYFERFGETSKDILSFAADYTEYLMFRQQAQIPLESWRPAEATEVAISECDTTALDLIGCIVRLATGDSRVHSGRIVDRRHDTVYNRWEHQVHFKSGAEGRNVSHTQWLCLDEHACMVGGALKWVRAVDGAFWPALEMHQSGVQLIANRCLTAQPRSSVASTAATTEKRLYYLFAEERTVSMNSKDARLVVPYFAKSKETRLYCGKRLNLAYGLAALEREEMETVRRAFASTNSTSTCQHSRSLVDGYTTGMLRSLVESYARLNNPKAPLLAPVPEAGLTTAPVATAADGNGAGNEKDKDTESVFDLSLQCYRHMLQFEYCQAVSRHPVADVSADTQSSSDPTLSTGAGPATETTDGVDGESRDNGSNAVKDGHSIAGLPTAPLKIESVPPSRVLCLDRTLLEVECGLQLPSDSNHTAGSVHPNTPFSPSPVLFHFPKPHNSDHRKPTKATKRKSASFEDVSSESGAVPGVNGPKLRLIPCEFKDLMFKKYKADTLRKQEEMIAQKEAEEEEKQQRAAARKARLAEMSATAHVNPWFADGEDFTRKSSRLSGVARPAYSDLDGENIVVTDLKTTMKVDAPRQATKADAQLCSLQSLIDDATTTNGVKEPSATTKLTRGSAKNKKKRAQEEEEYQEFLHSTAQQPRLLSDVDRDTWVGSVVTYLVSSEKGRVIEYRSGWAVVRTLKGTINCRPYQLELVEPASEAMEQYEDEEMWALCGEEAPQEAKKDEQKEEEHDKRHLTSVTYAPPSVPTAMDIDGFDFSDSVFANTDENAATQVDDAGLDDSDLMYNAFVNDEEYEAFLLDQFDPHTAISKSSDTRRPGAQAARQQQLKPSRTKFLETVPLSEEEKKKRLQALAKKREQAKMLLSRGQASAVNGSVSAAPTVMPAVRTTSITRKKEISTVDDDLVLPEKEISQLTGSSARASAGSIKRDAPVAGRDTQQHASLNVMKLGTAPPLARAILPRNESNTIRRPNVDSAPRKLAEDGESARRDHDSRASFPIKSSKDARDRDAHKDDYTVRDRDRFEDRTSSTRHGEDRKPSRDFESTDRAYRNDYNSERERNDRGRIDEYPSRSRRPERDSFGQDRYYDRGDRDFRSGAHSDDYYYDRNRYDRRESYEERRRDDGDRRDRGVMTSVRAEHSSNAQQARDPRIRSRLDRDATRQDAREDSRYGPSAATAGTASSFGLPNTASNATLSAHTPKNATRDTDYRSMKNASEAVRTAKANIDYLQASFLSEQDPLIRQPSVHAPGASAAPAKKVNFGAKPSSISHSFIDVDVLNITEDADVGYFSPVSVDESEEDVPIVGARNNVRVDEIDRFKPKATLQSPLQQQKDDVLHAPHQASAAAAGATHETEATQRRSRFAPVGATTEAAGPTIAEGIPVPATVPDLLAELAKFAEEINALSEVKKEKEAIEPEPELKLSKQERRRLKRNAHALEREQDAQRAATDAVELGEIVEDGQIISLLKKQRRFAEAGGTLSVTATTGSKGGRTVLVGDAITATPIILQPTAKAIKGAQNTSAADGGPAVVKKVPALLQIMQRQPPGKYTIDRTYPQFNHRSNEELAVRHMDEVMPQSMINLTAVLNGDPFFPTLGCSNLTGGGGGSNGVNAVRHVASPRASRFSNDLSVQAFDSAHPHLHEPTVLYPAQERAFEHITQRPSETIQRSNAEGLRRSRFASEPPLQIDKPRAYDDPHAQVLYPRTLSSSGNYDSRRTEPVDTRPYQDGRSSTGQYLRETDRYSQDTNRDGGAGLARGDWDQGNRNREAPNAPNNRRDFGPAHRPRNSLPEYRGNRRN